MILIYGLTILIASPYITLSALFQMTLICGLTISSPYITLSALFQMTLICGLTILIASTYITLSAQEKKLEAVRAEDIVIPGDNKVPDIEKSAQKNVEKVIEQIKPVEDNKQGSGLALGLQNFLHAQLC